MGIFDKAPDVNKLVEDSFKGLDGLITSKEEKEKIDIAKRKLATGMQEKALEQDDKFTKRAVYYLAFFWSIIAGGFIFAVSFIPIPESNTRLVDTITGFLLGTIIAGIINFFYGSSNSSKDKTKAMFSLFKNKKDQ